MKLILRILTMALLAIPVLLTACSKEKKTTPKNGLPSVINTIITQTQIDSLKKHGTVINEGTTPPTVNGAFLLSPDVCTFDNSGGNFAGQTFDDYEYKFSNQNTAKYTLRVDYLDLASGADDQGSDTSSTFISGSGTAFTIFAQTTSEESGINYQLLAVISGSVTSAGIANLQITNYLQSKGSDPNNKIEPVGTTRIFYDSDLISGPDNVIILNSLKNKVEQTVTKGAASSRSMNSSKF